MSGSHIAIQAAAERRRRQMQEEEERMTPYTQSEINEEWEFKIVRSVTEEFKKPDVFRQLVQEEAVSGWELLEKLDDGRVRFKRPTSQRRRDEMLPQGVDPYRTRVGITEAGLAFRIMLVIGSLVAVALTIVALVESGRLF